MKVIDYISEPEHKKLLKEARIVITHAGAGTIIECLNNGKTVIAAARKKEFGEHVNNHQEQLLENFSQSGYVLALTDFEQLDKLLEKAKNFKPKEFKSNNEMFINSLLEEINLLL